MFWKHFAHVCATPTDPTVLSVELHHRPCTYQNMFTTLYDAPIDLQIRSLFLMFSVLSFFCSVTSVWFSRVASLLFSLLTENRARCGVQALIFMTFFLLPSLCYRNYLHHVPQYLPPTPLWRIQIKPHYITHCNQIIQLLDRPACGICNMSKISVNTIPLILHTRLSCFVLALFINHRPILEIWNK